MKTVIDKVPTEVSEDNKWIVIVQDILKNFICLN